MDFGNGIVTEPSGSQRDHHASVGVGMVVIQSCLTPARTKNRLRLTVAKAWGERPCGNSLCSLSKAFWAVLNRTGLIEGLQNDWLPESLGRLARTRWVMVSREVFSETGPAVGKPLRR
jgi:hypothetical protein